MASESTPSDVQPDASGGSGCSVGATCGYGMAYPPVGPLFLALASGWLGIKPFAVAVISQFLQTYQKQLRDATVMVRHNIQHRLYEAMQRFHPDMPCVRRGLSMYCRVHNRDHVRFVQYMYLLGFCISLSPFHPEMGASHVMCGVAHPWQAAAIHEWMGAGYFSRRDAHSGGWPLAPWQWDLEDLPPWHGVSVPLETDLLVL